MAQTYGGQLERVDDMIAAAAMHQPLAAALAGLSSAHREILLLIAWADLSYEETTQALGTSVGTVRSRLLTAIDSPAGRRRRRLGGFRGPLLAGVAAVAAAVAVITQTGTSTSATSRSPRRAHVRP